MKITAVRCRGENRVAPIGGARSRVVPSINSYRFESRLNRSETEEETRGEKRAREAPADSLFNKSLENVSDSTSRSFALADTFDFG